MNLIRCVYNIRKLQSQNFYPFLPLKTMMTMDQIGGFEEMVLYILGGLMLIILWGCVYSFFRAIFFFIFSKGDDKQIKAAWDSIRHMIWGLFLTVMVIFMSPTLLKFMHVQGAEKYEARAIFVYMGKIISGISKLGNVITESQLNNQNNCDMYYDLNFDNSPSI